MYSLDRPTNSVFLDVCFVGLQSFWEAPETVEISSIKNHRLVRTRCCLRPVQPSPTNCRETASHSMVDGWMEAPSSASPQFFQETRSGMAAIETLDE